MITYCLQRYDFFLIPPKKCPAELCKTALTFTEIPVNSLRALNMPAMKSRRRTNYTGSIRPRFIVSGSAFIPCIIQKNIRYDSLLILQKLRPDVDFTTWQRNHSYVPTQRFLRRHVISRASGEKNNPLRHRCRKGFSSSFYLIQKTCVKKRTNS